MLCQAEVSIAKVTAYRLDFGGLWWTDRLSILAARTRKRL